MKKDIKEAFSNIWEKTKKACESTIAKIKELSAKAWEATRKGAGVALDWSKKMLAKAEEKVKTTLPGIDFKIKKAVLISLGAVIGLAVIYSIVVNAYASDTHVFNGDKCENCGISSSIVYKFTYISESDSYSVAGRKIWSKKYDELILPATYKGKPVTEIGENAFNTTKALTSVTIPEGVKVIGDSAFAYCHLLGEINIPDSVTEIRSGAFYECNGMKSLTLGSGLESVDEMAFVSCNLDTITGGSERYYVSGSCLIDSESEVVVVGSNGSVIPDGITAIGKYAFYGRKGLTQIMLPESVTMIHPMAFYNCAKLETATLGNATEIGYKAFYKCENLKETNIPDTVTVIHPEAFHSCVSLTKIVIPDSVVTIGDSAFSNCGSVTEIVIGSGVKKIGAKAFLLAHGLASVQFKVTEGWWVTKDAAATSGENLDPVELADPVKAADLIYNSYGYHIWNRD